MPGPSSANAGGTGNLQATVDDEDFDDEDFDMGYKANCRDSLKLKLDGSNYSEWKVSIVGDLEANPYALSVVTGQLLPPVDKNDKAKRKRYETGNRLARSVLLQCLTPALKVALFGDNVETIDASEMYRTIVSRYTKTNGAYQLVALEKLTTFKYDPNRPAGENLFRFNEINKRIEGLGIPLPEMLKVTLLLGSLPASWESIKQSFIARDESAQTLVALCLSIEAQAIRDGKFDTSDITALFSKMNTSGGRQHQKKK